MDGSCFCFRKALQKVTTSHDSSSKTMPLVLPHIILSCASSGCCNTRHCQHATDRWLAAVICTCPLICVFCVAPTACHGCHQDE